MIIPSLTELLAAFSLSFVDVGFFFKKVCILIGFCTNESHLDLLGEQFTQLSQLAAVWIF